MVPHRHVIRLKGGPGSGHRGHRGRPGLRGGSAPGVGGARDVESDWSAISSVLHESVFGDMTQEQVEDIFLLQGTRLDMEAVTSRPGRVFVRGIWYAPDGEKVGQFGRSFRVDDDGKRYAYNSSLIFESGFQGHGFATSLYDRQIGQLRKAGFDRITLGANISIGRYAWAKKGFDYSDPAKRAVAATNAFGWWAGGHGISKPTEGWPTFKSANDVATYKIPGVKLIGIDITNRDVPGNMSLDLGKAFMLDMGPQGHGSWDAELKL